jgi:hypothetical protein
MKLIDIFSQSLDKFGFGILIPLILLIIGVLGQWLLYDKCKQPGWACIVPIWNVIVFLKILGRPAWHLVYFFIPVYNVVFIIKLYVELCNCFGKKSVVDYILIIVFNGFYILNLGLSYDEKYFGPVYKKQKKAANTSEGNTSPRIAVVA